MKRDDNKGNGSTRHTRVPIGYLRTQAHTLVQLRRRLLHGVQRLQKQRQLLQHMLHQVRSEASLQRDLATQAMITQLMANVLNAGGKATWPAIDSSNSGLEYESVEELFELPMGDDGAGPVIPYDSPYNECQEFAYLDDDDDDLEA
jgi:hypothetical protein